MPIVDHPVTRLVFGSLITASTTLASLPTNAAEWLDQTELQNWNTPGATIPAAPATGADATMMESCRHSTRTPATPEDQAVVAAGWKLFGALQVFDGTAVIMGLSNFDGMCRPLDYQTFVFVDGKFAGTVSPELMDSRTDGAVTSILLIQRTFLSGVFSRYLESDALCCPSRTSRVQFEIQDAEGQPLLVPTQVITSPTSL